jgi:hypothetical protein
MPSPRSRSEAEERHPGFINKTHFDRITMIVRSAGFITSDLISSQNAVNFAYILYLRGRKPSGARRRPGATGAALVRHVGAARALQRATPRRTFDFDIRQIDSRGAGGLCRTRDPE